MSKELDAKVIVNKSTKHLISFAKELVVGPFQELIEEMGYEWFDGGKAFNLNIIGIRSRERRVGKFDDQLYLIYRDQWLDWMVKQFRITTDAGLYYHMNPINVKGTANLVPNQYKGVYKLDKHNGAYPALCQRLGKVQVYRDGNRDEIMDTDAPVDEGMFGINFHKTTRRSMTDVGKASAGCQVFYNSRDHDEVWLKTIRESIKHFGNSFTYTLIQD